MIWVVEPHADDAFLSMGGIIEAHPGEFGIITVYSDTRKRAEDAKRYADAVKAKWIGLKQEESGNREIAGSLDFESIRQQLSEQTDINDSENIWILPLGIGKHAEHISVKEMFLLNLGLKGRPFFYVDQPYATQLKHQEQLQTEVEGREVIFCMRPGARKYRHVVLFKDQAKFFYYNKPEDLEWKTFELVVM